MDCADSAIVPIKYNPKFLLAYPRKICRIFFVFKVDCAPSTMYVMYIIFVAFVLVATTFASLSSCCKEGLFFRCLLAGMSCFVFYCAGCHVKCSSYSSS